MRLFARLVMGSMLLCLAGPACGDGDVQGKPGGKMKRPGAGRGGAGKGPNGGRPGGPGRGDSEKALAVVETASVVRGDVHRYYDASGTLSALKVAQIRPLQSGIVRKVLVDEGDLVKKGQLLVKLDGRERDLMARRDEITSVNAQLELKRLQTIVERQAIARQEVEKQEYSAQSARANAKLSSYQATQDAVTAPFAGTITARNIDIGNLATSGDVLFELVDVSELELEIHTPERESSLISDGTVATIELLDGGAFEAKLIRRSPVVDPLTGTVKLTFRAQSFPANAMPGAFVRAKVLQDTAAGVVKVPTTAVVEDKDNAFAYVIEGGVATKRKVRIGLKGDEHVQIAEGLKEGEIVIAVQVANVRDGVKVQIKAEDGVPAAQATKSTDTKKAASPS